MHGDQRLELRVAPPRVVTVLGLLGEPFLRFSPRGVDVNLASPTAGSTGLIGSADAVASPRVTWRRIRSGHVLAWHENRLRPVAAVRAPSQRAREVGRWSIPLIVDGRPTTLSGSEWYATGPSPWPWVLIGALIVAVAAVAGRRLAERAQGLLASSLLLAALIGLMSSWAGVIIFGRATVAVDLFSVVFGTVTAVFLFVGVAAARGERRLGVIALIGAFAATFALPLITIFEHGFVLSALSGSYARLAAAAAVVCGLAAAAVCAPAVMALLSADNASPRGAHRVARHL